MAKAATYSLNGKFSKRLYQLLRLGSAMSAVEECVQHLLTLGQAAIEKKNIDTFYAVNKELTDMSDQIIDPFLIESWANLQKDAAVELLEDEFIEDALINFERAIQLNPENSEAQIEYWYTKALLLENTKSAEGEEMIKVINGFNDLVDKFPDNTRYKLRYAEALKLLGGIPKHGFFLRLADRKYKECLPLIIKRDKADFFCSWAAVLMVYGKLFKQPVKYKKAITLLEHALEANPQNSLTYILWGNAVSALAILQGKEKLMKVARKKFNDGMSREPGNINYCIMAALAEKEALLAWNNVDFGHHAIELLEKTKALQPRFHVTYRHLGNTSEYMGRLTRDSEQLNLAQENYNRSAQLKPATGHHDSSRRNPYNHR